MKFPWTTRPATVKNAPRMNKGQENLYYNTISFCETGPMRDGNEDSVLVLKPGIYAPFLFAMVADGMGGHNAGEVASGIACDAALRVIKEGRQQMPGGLLQQIMMQAHEEIRNAASANAAHEGMGTTAVMLLIEKEHAYYAHAGDSRLYLLRQGQLQQLTEDHTLVNSMVKRGELKREEAAVHHLSNVITQALGSTERLDPDVHKDGVKLLAGDRLLLCSDGVTDVLRDDELQALLNIAELSMVSEIIRALCMLRKAADNISAILIEVTSAPLQAATAITKEQNVML